MAPELLLALLSLTQPRRPKVIYNCLRGRKTVSILFWSLRYDLLSWLNTFPNLTWTSFEATLGQLVASKQVQCDADGQLLLSPAAARINVDVMLPKTTRQRAKLLHLKQLRETVLLGLQALAQQSHHQMNYFPLSVGEPARQAVRSWFEGLNQQHDQKKAIASLANWLQQQSELQANLFVAQFVGGSVTGLTSTQLAQQFELPSWELELRQLANWLEFAGAFSSSNTSLGQLIAACWQSQLSASIAQTLLAIQADKSRQQISEQRHLKLSTVNEHLLTAAILLPIDQFPFTKFLSPEVHHRLAANMPQNIDLWQFDQQSVTTDFFLFRLTQILESKHDTGTDTRETG
ncbi:helix-turn-helix domain-containing protein [Furfurilactobacillus curtus]|uniref:Helicase Helix-turn-helix domain-containing protein n=1 Tax=Furfurilactobacillus curtus TaxID=1746200 RepID=A0ABQ5JLJ3_9LACO